MKASSFFLILGNGTECTNEMHSRKCVDFGMTGNGYKTVACYETLHMLLKQ